MKIQLIIQCIDTFGFKPPADKLYFFADGLPLEAVYKDNGFYVITKGLPDKFNLSINSTVYYSCEYCIKTKPDKNFVTVDLIRKNPPNNEQAIWIDTKGFSKAVLGYEYFFLAGSIKSTDTVISVENPFRFCLEGRKFLIRETQLMTEEFITIEKAENKFMTLYDLKGLKNSYDSETSIMLPAFDLNGCEKIPVKKPVMLPVMIWLYDKYGGSKKIEIK